jgi:hypothetical protein
MTEYAVLEKELTAETFNELRSKVGAVKNLPNLMPFEQESIGGFAWFWNISGATNQQTYNLMNTAAAYNPDTAAVKASATSVTNAALAIYQALQYRLSETDNTALSQSQTDSATQANNVVATWNSCGQPQITDAQLKEGNVSTRQDYIVNQFLQVYSADGKLTRADFINSRNPSSLFPKMPSSLAPVLSAVAQYIAATEDVQTILDNQMSAGWIKGRLVKALQSPVVANGAITTKDATSGNSSVLPAWIPQQSTTDLQGDLDKGGTFTITLNVTKENSTTVKVSVNGKGGGTVPINFLSFFGSAGASYNSVSEQGSGTSIDIQLTYTGVGVVNFAPLPFNQSSLQGWYEPNLIAQAYGNIGVTGGSKPAKSGYVLSGLNETYKLGKNGNVGYIAAAVFSNPPSVKITYKDGNYSNFNSKITQESSWGVSLFGIKLFGGDQSYEKAIVQKESADAGFSVTFPPKKITSAGAAAGNQLATILAVSPVWLGVT